MLKAISITRLFVVSIIVFTFILFYSSISFGSPQLISKEKYVTSDHSISGSTVVWSEFVSSPGSSAYDTEIFSFDGNIRRQITDDDFWDMNPYIDGSHIVWEKADGDDTEIYMFDGVATTKLSNNQNPDNRPKVSDGNVSWITWNQLNYFDGQSTKIITSTLMPMEFGYFNEVYSHDVDGKNVVWSDWRDGDNEIFLYDGSDTIQITDNIYDDNYPRISNGRIVWESEHQIFLYDGSTTTQLTNAIFNDLPDISGDHIAWIGLCGITPEIILYDGSSTVRLGNKGTVIKNFSLSGGNVVWEGQNNYSDRQLYHWDGPPPVSDIFFSDGSGIKRLTNNRDSIGTGLEHIPEISGDNITWRTTTWLDPKWMPDNQLYYYNLSDSKARQVWTSNGPGTWDAKASKQVVGDYNGDGKDDVAIMYDYKTSREARIFVFLANNSGGLDSPVLWWSSGEGNFDASGATLTSGDYNNDGKDDIAALYDFSAQRDVKAFVFKSNGSKFSIQEWWHAGAGNWDASGSKLVSGDFDGDGKSDMAIFYGYQNERDVRIFVFLSNGTTFKGSAQWWHAGVNNWDWEGSKIIADDFDGDGKSDIAVFYGYETERDVTAFVFTSTGSKFPASVPWWSAGPNNWDHSGSELVSGDYNGDGIADMGVMYGYGASQTAIFTFPSGTKTFSNSNVYYNSGPGNWPSGATDILSGDFDGDGTDQFGAFFDFGNAYSGLSIFE